jgi:hypothetical protein
MGWLPIILLDLDRLLGTIGMRLGDHEVELWRQHA